MKRTVKPLYGMKGYPNQARFDTFKADLFAGGVDVAIPVDHIDEHTAGHGVMIDGVLLQDGTITTTAPTIKSVAAAITAKAGGTKAAATALTKELNIITVCATALDSVQLPSAVVGQSITVVNLGAATLAVYAAGDVDTIDDIAAANPAIVNPEDVVTFHCYTVDLWQSDFEADAVYDRIYTNTIAENTAANGVAIDGVTLKDGGGTFTAQIAISGGATQQLLLTSATSQKALHIASSAQAVDSVTGTITVNGGNNYNFLSVGITPSTTLSSATSTIGTNFSFTTNGSDADGTFYKGHRVYFSSTALSKSDLVGFEVIHSGTATGASGTTYLTGVNIAPSGLTINSASTAFYGMVVDTTGITQTQANVYGALFNMPQTVTGGSCVGIQINGTAAAMTGLSIVASLTGISLSGAMTTGLTVASTTLADGILISGTTPVDGLHISSACSANAINLSGASAVGISLSGAFTTAAIDITATAHRAIMIGDKTTAIPISAQHTLDAKIGNNYMVGVFSEVAVSDTSQLDDLMSAWYRTRVNADIDVGGNFALCGVKTQLRLYGGASGGTDIYCWNASGLWAVLETSGATTTFKTGSVAGAVYANVGLTATTALETGAFVAGVVVNCGVAASNVTKAGTAGIYGILIQQYTAGLLDFDAGIKIAALSSTIGVDIGSCTTGISLSGTITNAIDITAATSLTNLFKFNAIAGCVVANDVDPKEIPSGGGLGADGAIAILVGGDTCYIPYFTAIRS